MIEYSPDDMFAWGILDAWAKLAQGLGCPRVEDWRDSTPPPIDTLSLDAKLPPGVQRQTSNGKLYGYVYMPREYPARAHKLTFGQCAATPENARRLATLAALARRLRDEGLEAEEIKRRVQATLDQQRSTT